MNETQLFLDWFKGRAEFFKAGSIVPQRILKGKRKWKHLLKFSSDCWALPTPAGYIVAVDVLRGRAAVRFDSVTGISINFSGSPYGGVTQFIGNEYGDEKWSQSLERQYNLALGVRK